jgi:hypothetical protein
VSEYARFDIIDCVVTAHAPWGLVVETPSGEHGYIDSDGISDRMQSADSWPGVGQVMPAVVLGCLRDGRVRLAAKPSYLAYVRSAVDINASQELLVPDLAEIGPDQLIALDYRRSAAPELLVASDDVRSPWRLVSGSVEELLSLMAEGGDVREVGQDCRPAELPRPPLYAGAKRAGACGEQAEGASRRYVTAGRAGVRDRQQPPGPAGRHR